MILFFTNHIDADYATFSEVEARHCTQVLRKKEGDPITFVDGMGGWYEGSIETTSKRSLVVKIQTRKKANPPSPSIHLAIAPTKNIDRFEWFLEKATEIGISQITPLLCTNSERKRIRPDRLEKILLSAMKQSLRTWLPKLNDLSSFQDFLQSTATENAGQRFIAHCQDENLSLLKNNYKAGQDVCILIGPEGDFSKEEIELAIKNQFNPVSLGTARLRTETAGMVACHTLNFLNEK